MNSLRQQLIAVSIAGGLCGAAIATAVLVILQTAGIHAACTIGSVSGGEAIVETASAAHGRLADLPPEAPRNPA